MWFSASILMKPEPKWAQSDDLEWEENIVLIEADDEDQARVLAEEIGRRDECEYETIYGELAWKLNHIAIYAIGDDELRTGTELFSRFLRASEVASLLTPFE